MHEADLFFTPFTVRGILELTLLLEAVDSLASYTLPVITSIKAMSFVLSHSSRRLIVGKFFGQKNTAMP